MRQAATIAAALVAFGALLWSRQGRADMGLDQIFQKWGTRYGVDWRLLKAHAVHESNLDPSAVNARDPSYGIAQILCKSDGMDGRCTNVFYVDGWDKATPRRLLDADFNISIQAQVVAYNVKAFGMPRAIAVYNRWDQRTAPQAGPFANQSYVDKVIGTFKQLGGTI